METKSIKVPDWVYGALVAVQRTLAFRGIEAVPHASRAPERCPLCGTRDRIEQAVDHRRCGHCAFAWPLLTGPEATTLGVVIGIAAASLASQFEKPREAEIETLRRAATDSFHRMQRHAAVSGVAEREAKYKTKRRRRKTRHVD